MKTFKSYAVAVLLATAFSLTISSCKKTEEPLPTGPDLNYFHGGLTKTWRMAEYYVNGVNFQVPAWAADNVLVFSRDGTGMWIFGEVDKDPLDTIKCDFFTWSFSKDSLSVDGLNSSPGGRITAIPVINEHMLVEQLKSASGDVFRYVYVDVVLPDPGAGVNNRHLTNGLTKIWKIREVTYNGVPHPVEEWRKEDQWVFNTDGTGWFTFGENSEFPGDTTNNDHFKWWFSNNETRLELEEFTTGGMILLNDCNILALSDSLMIIEEKVFFNGDTILVRATRVPAVK